MRRGGKPRKVRISAVFWYGQPMLSILVVAFVDAKHRPQVAGGSDIAGVGNATTGSLTDKLTREHRMTLDEAHLILNTKRTQTLEDVLRVSLCFYCCYHFNFWY